MAWSDYEEFEYYPVNPDYHARYSIQLCELVEVGFVDFSEESWDFDAYSAEQRNRLYKKLQDRYFFREISITPPGRWKHEFLRKLNEIMPKYKPLYAKLEAGADILADYDEYGSYRDIYSDFPATLLNPENQDYGSNGRDTQREVIRQGDWISKANDVMTKYNDVDVMIVEEMGTMFTPVLTSVTGSY